MIKLNQKFFLALLAVFIFIFIMIIVGVIFINKKEIEQPEEPLPEKERTIEDAILDLSVPVSIPQNGEDISEVVESISNPTPINKENSVSDDDIKNAIEGLLKPVEINKK